VPFSAVLGQDQAAGFLRQALAGGRVAHAYLFRGPDGVGKTKTALAFAADLLCRERAPEHDSCGACSICRRIADGNHPDVQLIETLEGKRRDLVLSAVDASGNRSYMNIHLQR
jgi:DNA polymerase-3 subunit delta'